MLEISALCSATFLATSASATLFFCEALDCLCSFHLPHLLLNVFGLMCDFHLKARLLLLDLRCLFHSTLECLLGCFLFGLELGLLCCFHHPLCSLLLGGLQLARQRLHALLQVFDLALLLLGLELGLHGLHRSLGSNLLGRLGFGLEHLLLLLRCSFAHLFRGLLGLLLGLLLLLLLSLLSSLHLRFGLLSSLFRTLAGLLLQRLDCGFLSRFLPGLQLCLPLLGLHLRLGCLLLCLFSLGFGDLQHRCFLCKRNSFGGFVLGLHLLLRQSGYMQVRLQLLQHSRVLLSPEHVYKCLHLLACSECALDGLRNTHRSLRSLLLRLLCLLLLFLYLFLRLLLRLVYALLHSFCDLIQLFELGSALSLQLFLVEFLCLNQKK